MIECVFVYLFNLRCGGQVSSQREEHFDFAWAILLSPMRKLLIKHINYLFIL